MRCLQKMLGLGLCLVATTGWSGSADAQLVWEQTSWSSEHPFTETMVRVEFRCKNIGDYPVRITKLTGDERGARPGRAGYAIQPGQSGSATFIVDTKRLFRPESYSLAAYTDDHALSSHLFTAVLAPKGWSRMNADEQDIYTKMCDDILANEPIPVMFSKRSVSARDLDQETKSVVIEIKSSEGVSFGLTIQNKLNAGRSMDSANRPIYQPNSVTASLVETEPGQIYKMTLTPVANQAVSVHPQAIDLVIDLPERQSRRQYMEGGVGVIWLGDPVARQMAVMPQRSTDMRQSSGNTR